MKRTFETLVLSVMLSQCGLAAPILLHQGTNDPTTENWIRGDGTITNGSAGTVGWVITDNSPTDRLAYKDNFTSSSVQAQLRNQWSLFWRFSMLSAADIVANPSSEAYLKVELNLTNSTGNLRRYNFVMGRNGNDAAVNLGGLGSFYIANAGSGFHTWQFTRTNQASDTAQLYVDNMFVTNYAGFFDSGYPLAYWGAPSAAASTLSEWSLVLLEVPEPSTLGLAGLAAAIALVFRKRKS